MTVHFENRNIILYFKNSFDLNRTCESQLSGFSLAVRCAADIISASLFTLSLHFWAKSRSLSHMPSQLCGWVSVKLAMLHALCAQISQHRVRKQCASSFPFATGLSVPNWSLSRHSGDVKLAKTALMTQAQLLLAHPACWKTFCFLSWVSLRTRKCSSLNGRSAKYTLSQVLGKEVNASKFPIYSVIY